MKLENFPKLTIILRGYSYDEAMNIIKVASKFKHNVGIEVTTNNQDYLDIIRDGNKKFGDLIYIGVGTVLNSKQAKDSIDNGAQFMLGPSKFTPDVFEVAKESEVITVPGAMTPSEVSQMFNDGADIVKIFPAITVSPNFFKQIQGPLGNLNLMAVGGVNKENAKDFIECGAKYLGIGSSMFNKEDIKNRNEANITVSIQKYLDIWGE